MFTCYRGISRCSTKKFDPTTKTAEKQIFALEQQEGENLRSGTSLAALTLQAPSALLSPLGSPEDVCQLQILEDVDVEVMEMETRGKNPIL